MGQHPKTVFLLASSFHCAKLNNKCDINVVRDVESEINLQIVHF